MRSLVRDTFNCLETMIQDEVDCEINSPNSTNSTNSNNDRYACQLCEPYKRKMYSSKGAFRRHVSTEHAPRSRFFCPVCGWHTCRRDKVWDHFRHRHPPPARLRKNNIKHTRFRPPRECPLCKKSVQSWEAYFNCVSEHCRIHGSSPGTSGVQSRRNSGDSGSGGDGFNGNFASGNPFNGQGPQTHFPSGGGDNSNNGSNYFSGYGSSFYGNGYSRENSFAQQVEQRLPHSLNSVPDRDDASPDPVFFSHNPEKKGSEINRLGPNSVSSHHQLLDATLERNPQDIPPKDNLGHHSGRKAQNPRGSSQTTSCNDKSPHQATSFKELSLKKSQARPASEPQNLPPEKCKLCGHLMTTCVECKLQKGTVDRCHLCTGKASQQHGLPKVLEDYDQYYDFACNGMSDRNRSASKIAWALEQVSQAFKPKGDPCSIEISRTSRDYLFNESSQVYALQVSEQSIFKATGSSYSTKALSSALEPHTTRSRFTAMTLAVHSPQIYSKIGHSDSSKGIHIELSEVRYDTQNIIGDTSVAHEPDSRKVAASELTAEHAIPHLAKTPESLCIIQSKSVGGFTLYHASCVVKDRQSSQGSTPLTNAPSAAEDQLTRKRRSKLRRKLQVIIGILVLQASVAHTLPVSKQLEDRNPRNPTVVSEDTDLIEASSDLDSSDLDFLPQWLREMISTFSAGLIENVESSMFTTPVYKAEEEIWPKVKTFVGSMASYLETPISPTVLEQHIAEYRKFG
ncbi:hypothetical protein BDV37DRAFT_268952 [Aspergillus pseudonomiae]|uniref:C2H2-type domain-containing protein n=1 Tax=Aspergillus pseudonomiae TaxID=1506151 RepID=A0A5N7DMX3_9EURO|nr:uncharacterized protein BDV37DRAFT_268952 [Aspergillus pseudonomiae]KAE8407811.1 hypothetical protein BDV37DRAFT_268952 [Aspergillus pseudonomiae]